MKYLPISILILLAYAAYAAFQIEGTPISTGKVIIKRTDAGAADYNPSALTSDYLITADNSASARAITVSSEDVASGSIANPRAFIIKDEYTNAASLNLTITLENGGTIDGTAAGKVLNSNGQSVNLYVTGTNGFIY